MTRKGGAEEHDGGGRKGPRNLRRLGQETRRRLTRAPAYHALSPRAKKGVRKEATTSWPPWSPWSPAITHVRAEVDGDVLGPSESGRRIDRCSPAGGCLLHELALEEGRHVWRGDEREVF